MPVPERYQQHWFQTPEPCFKPGYTGYLPESGPKRRLQFGETYGEMSHRIMKSHPVAGLRMGNILDCSNEKEERLKIEALVWIHEVTSQNTRYRKQMVPGYTGYIPRRKYLVGKGLDEDCKMALTLMEKIKMSGFFN